MASVDRRWKGRRPTSDGHVYVEVEALLALALDVRSNPGQLFEPGSGHRALEGAQVGQGLGADGPEGQGYPHPLPLLGRARGRHEAQLSPQH